MNTLIEKFIIAIVKTYQYVLSPVLQHSCRFEPTCSNYFIESVKAHGWLKGSFKGILRILKCHPLTWLGGSAGYDPVQKERKI
jgi:putative membrane protein insertion efficiency factor